MSPGDLLHAVILSVLVGLWFGAIYWIVDWLGRPR